MRASFANLVQSLNLTSHAVAQRGHAASVLRWTLLLVPMAIAVGTLCAAFLWSLDVATRARSVVSYRICEAACRRPARNGVIAVSSAFAEWTT